TPESWLEVGCGGGQFLHRLAQTYPECAVHGIDLSSPAIIFAKEHWSHPNLTFSLQNQKTLDFPDNHFDIVSATLVCHHMTDDELHTFLNQATRIAKKGVLLNDLHRHSLASLLFAVTAPLLFHNRLITHDGLLSIRRAFTKADWLHLLKPFSKARLSWYFPFRWIVWIPTED
ncbi:MAG: methyltransferase domain-containing protein, partial [Chlamydiia bacterium]|nr:methyltransferase domain-containing protein [Chlamydiia bacterium]